MYVLHDNFVGAWPAKVLLTKKLQVLHKKYPGVLRFISRGFAVLDRALRDIWPLLVPPPPSMPRITLPVSALRLPPGRKAPALRLKGA